jgi:NitT/TauT family transport system substrate-binding protein
MHNSVFTGSLKTVLASFDLTTGKTAARRIRSAIPILSLFFFLLALFGSGVQEGEARTVRVSVPAASISVTAFFVARDRGFYKQEGLDVQLIQMPGGIAIQALVAGSLDFSTVVAGGLSAAIRGAPLVNIYDTFYRPMWWIYANPEIRDVAGLKGKKVAVSGLADSSYIMLQEILKKNGLQGGGRDVVTIVMGDSPSRFNALLSGTIDATPVTLPYNFRAEEASFRELVSFIKEDLVLLAGGLAVQENFYNTEPVLVQAFMRATLKGFIYASENRAGTIPILARNIKITEQLAAKTYDLGRTAMTPDGSLTEDAQKKAVDLVVKLLDVKDPPPFKKFFNFSQTTKIYKELRSEGWKPGS